MMLVLVSSFFCIFNIVLWIFFLSRYKKFFSTDEILESTREELDRMIADVNRNAGRNIDIIEDRIRELKAVVAEADRHVAFAQSELERQKSLSSFQQKIEASSPHRSGGRYKQSAAEKYKRNSSQQVSAQIGRHSDDSYGLTSEGRMYVQNEKRIQADLFDQVSNEREIVSDSGTVFSVESAGTPVTKVPVVGPNVAYADNPIEPKKSFREMVHDLNLVGHSVEEIAMELGRSTTEVQMVLDMDF